ncbi:uncharacterized protein BP01DRAFT_126665 [Aspergillus saccharolyticus JOP 1030-1]|uniref:Zn(2)-C6 fungal-type domain-containing protein n=1 Tax=Aspergillus saccharolyticus JOP 1030-1 TaxID=1450539 RepID=A0A318ZS29_9EURO|nr:hypothetical protein BP01DRAFT_126665 [Aspergillus saccharolyticus JOP 1030-1]PYH42888.1 hypothetical protein BP01DRAFT_126665 [Aspergillus saccharolyticus JOP 1030-1]
MMSAAESSSAALHKACDACRSRKTRCSISGTNTTCNLCLVSQATTTTSIGPLLWY